MQNTSDTSAKKTTGAKLYKSPNGLRVRLTCQQCGEEFEVEPHRVERAKYCGFMCKQRGAAQSGKSGDTQRYTGSRSNYIKFKGRHLHRVVAEEMLGRKLKPGEIVHHKNGDKWDNRKENLSVMTQSEHAKIHHKEMLKARKEKAGY